MTTRQPDQPPVVDDTWLREHLADDNLRLVDASVQLTFDAHGAQVASSRDKYAAEHIPGALFVEQLDLADPEASAPFTPVDSERFAEVMGGFGIGEDHTVVVYDHVNGIWATRLWWHLGLEGFDRAVVLDGGLAAWKAAGGPVTDEVPSYPPATFTPRRNAERLVSTDDVERAVDDDTVLLVNALDADQFAAGHIPGSVNVPAGELVRPDGTLKGTEELRAIFAEVGALDPDVTPVTYCGGGIAATSAALALRLAGRYDVAVYDGSMSAWTAGGGAVEQVEN